jgi:hypothetical protein
LRTRLLCGSDLDQRLADGNALRKVLGRHNLRALELDERDDWTLGDDGLKVGLVDAVR